MEEMRGEVEQGKARLDDTRAQLRVAHEELAGMEELRGELDAARAMAGVDRKELAEMKGELDDTRAQLSVAHEELAAGHAELAVAQVSASVLLHTRRL